MTIKHSILVICAALFAAGCASTVGQHPYVAPTPETVITLIEEMTSTPGNVVYVENHSSVPVIVYSYTLHNCDNVLAACNTAQSADLRLKADSRAALFHIEPVNSETAFHFEYTLGWRADSSKTAAPGAVTRSPIRP